MNRFALFSLYRSLTRHKLHAALNIGGLALGIAVFIVLGLYVRFETSYETWLPGHENIYQVQSEWNMPGSPFDGVVPQTADGMLEMMREDYPDIVGARILPSTGTVLQNGVGVDEEIAPADPEFLKLFQLDMIQGERSALDRPKNAVLSETAAATYFPGGRAMGETLSISREGTITNYTIAGIFRDLPANTLLDFSILIPFPEPKSPEEVSLSRNLGSLSSYTYLRFENPSQAADFENKMGSFVSRHGSDLGEDAADILSLPLTPIADLHLASGSNDSLRMTVATLGIVGILTLLIALVNYINLATARAGLRAREVAMRKVLGANRHAIIRQFLGEAILTVAIASLLGLILAELSVPFINSAGGLSLTIPYAVVLPGLAVLCVFAGVLAGFYPAIVLSRFRPASVLASSRSPGGGKTGARVREVLVVFQFGLSIAFMIGTATLFAQTAYIRSADIGFDRTGLLVIPSFNDPSIDGPTRSSLLAEFQEIPEVSSLTVATMAVGGSGSNSVQNVPIPGIPGNGPSLRKIDVGPDFFQTYGIATLAGRVFAPQFGQDDATQTEDVGGFNILINRQAVKALGFSSPEKAIGTTVGGERARTIVGVVENAQFLSPRTAIDPTFYVYKPELPTYAVPSLRFTGDPDAVTQAVRSIWQRSAGTVPFDAETADARLSELYENDDRTARLFGIGASLAVLIGVVGLWGLASFNTARRTKEIGIRKSLGASATDIVKLLVGQFLRPVLIANLIGWPLAYFAMSRWLAGFADRIDLSPLYFLGASLLAVAMAVVTVLGQSVRASRTPPAWALRHD